jgi:hypothetical protein
MDEYNDDDMNSFLRSPNKESLSFINNNTTKIGDSTIYTRETRSKTTS